MDQEREVSETTTTSEPVEATQVTEKTETHTETAHNPKEEHRTVQKSPTETHTEQHLEALKPDAQ